MEDKCFCHFNGLAVKDAHARKYKVDRLSYIDELEIAENAKSENPKPFSTELYNILKSKERVYIETASGVYNKYIISPNPTNVYNPFGYDSLEKLCTAYGLDITKVTENVEYKVITENGKTGYFGRLSTIAQKQFDGNIRVNATPKDSTDATSKVYVDKNSFANVPAYKVIMKGSSGALFAESYDINAVGKSFVYRNDKGETRVKVSAESSDDTAVNKQFVSTEIGSAKNEVKKYTDDAIERAVFGTVNKVESATNADNAKDYIEGGTIDEELKEIKQAIDNNVIKTEHILNNPNYDLNFTLIESGSESYYVVSGFGENHSYKNITIPSVYNNKKVLEIADNAFKSCYWLENVTINKGITKIGNHAFFGCSRLVNIDIPESVTHIGEACFSACSAITNIVIPDSVKSIGSSAFRCEKLEYVKISNNLVSIEQYVFYGCHSLKNIIIPDSVTTIGQYAFGECSNLKSIVIPDTVTTIESYAFYGCSSVETIHIGKGVTNIYTGAFRDCVNVKTIYYNAQSIESFYTGSSPFENVGVDTNGVKVIIGNSVSVLPRYMFYGDDNNSYSINIVSIEFESVSMCSSIDSKTIYNCPSIKSIMIPKSVTIIEQGAFIGCEQLEIFCEALEKPEGWVVNNSITSINWNRENYPVYWNMPVTQYDLLKRLSAIEARLSI